MSKLFSKSHRERKTGAESPNIPAPNSLAVSQSISASSSTILEHLPMETPKKGILSYFKGRSKLGTGSKKQSAGGTIAYSSIKRHDIAPDEADIPIQPDTLLIERVNLNLPEDSNYQRKLDILDTSMEVLGLFEEVSKAASLVVPDALGLVLKGTAAILGRLKVSSSTPLRFCIWIDTDGLSRKWWRINKRGENCFSSSMVVKRLLTPNWRQSKITISYHQNF